MITYKVTKVVKFIAVLGLIVSVSSCTAIKRNVAMKQAANFFEKVERNPVTRTPEEVGLAFTPITITTEDSVKLSAWFIPSPNSKKLVVFNHFLIGNKAGAIPHKDWGNVSVNFMPVYKHLVDGGYNILSYDLRNHGASDMYKDGHIDLTMIEYKDAIAAMKYAENNYPTFSKYVYSQCYGTVSTMRAIKNDPETFKNVKAYINIQPLSADAFVNGISKKFNIEGENNLTIFSKQLKKKTGYTVDQLSVQDIANSIKIPTLLVQVKDDWRTTNVDIENIFNKLGTADKKLLWIESETERLEGYNYFGKQPEEMLNWLNKY